MASAARTTARRCARSSRSTATTSCWRRSRSWPRRARSTRPRPSRRSRPTASTRSGLRRGRSEEASEVAGTEQVLVPYIGDFDDVPVIEVLVAVGDEVAAEDPLVVLESDKATMEVPSPAAGKVAAIEVSVGDKVKQGSPILRLEVSGGNGAEPAPGATVAATSIAAQESEQAGEVEEPPPAPPTAAPPASAHG